MSESPHIIKAKLKTNKESHGAARIHTILLSRHVIWVARKKQGSKTVPPTTSHISSTLEGFYAKGQAGKWGKGPHISGIVAMGVSGRGEVIRIWKLPRYQPLQPALMNKGYNVPLITY